MRKYWFLAAIILLFLAGMAMLRHDPSDVKGEPPISKPVTPVEPQPVPTAIPEQKPSIAPPQPARQTITLDKPSTDVHAEEVDPAGISYNAKRPAERQVLPNVTITDNRALSIKLSPERDRSVDIQRGADGKDYQVQWKQKF